MEKHGTCVITGATSGIGAAFAERYAGMGYHLMLVGRRAEPLRDRAAGLAARHAVRAEPVVCDLSEPAELARLEASLSALPEIEVLVNNAGFGLARPYLSEDVDASSRMVDVHCRAALRLTHAVVPEMKRAGTGAIINVASMAAFIPLSNDPPYSATKAFLVNFSEGLWTSLRASGIRVQALCPGFTRTEFHARLGIPAERLRNRGPVRWMSAEKVVDASLRGLARGTVICVPGFWNKVLVGFERHTPRRILYRAVAGRGL